MYINDSFSNLSKQKKANYSTYSTGLTPKKTQRNSVGVSSGGGQIIDLKIGRTFIKSKFNKE